MADYATGFLLSLQTPVIADLLQREQPEIFAGIWVSMERGWRTLNRKEQNSRGIARFPCDSAAFLFLVRSVAERYDDAAAAATARKTNNALTCTPSFTVTRLRLVTHPLHAHCTFTSLHSQERRTGTVPCFRQHTWYLENKNKTC